jgi:hypothetical protein
MCVYIYMYIAIYIANTCVQMTVALAPGRIIGALSSAVSLVEKLLHTKQKLKKVSALVYLPY